MPTPLKLNSRRDFLKTISLTAVGLIGQKQLLASARPRKKPNIILIMADDLGYECLSCYGSMSYKTPVLDNLAQNGIKFNRCYSGPLCTPSRVKIMTGKYNFRNYVKFSYLAPDQITFANLLKNQGYATCVAGKWQLAGDENDTFYPPNHFGFDEYCLWQLHSWPASKRGRRYPDPKIYQNGDVNDLKGQYGPDVFCDYINEFIERKKNKPFLVYYPMVLAHNPFLPTPSSSEWTSERYKPDSSFFKDMVEYMDKKIGKILKKLDELHLRENTLVLFTGDNGTHVDITSKMKDGHTIKGGKGYTHDYGIHVPLIANWKNSGVKGKICDDLIGFEDFLPTLTQAAGLKSTDNTDGQSFLPQILGKKTNPKEWLFMYARPQHPCIKEKWEETPELIEPESLSGGHRTYSKRFVMDKRWKLYSTGHLFDLKTDILEKHPIPEQKDSEESAMARKKLKEILFSIK